jgi:type VI secretion system protein ImpF
MPEIPPEQPLIPLVPSVLDRLIDLEPAASRDPALGHGQILRDVLRSVRRDLEDLLNTRARCKPLPADLREVHQSLISYGIPDLCAASLGTKDERDRFCTVLLAIITRFDRRLHKVRVRSPEQDVSSERKVRFQIDAELRFEPAAELISFDSALSLVTGTFEVKGQADER